MDGAAHKPSVYILHGDDEFAIAGAQENLLSQMGDPIIAEMNTTRLDGRTATEEELRKATYSLPFLAERRLVILSNPMDRFAARDRKDPFLAFLDGLPPSTALVLVILDEYEGQRKGWKKLPDEPQKKHWLRIWAENAGDKAWLGQYFLPSQGSLPKWIVEQARKLGGVIHPKAAGELARYTGYDKRIASQELEKLLIYVDRSRPVDFDDVVLLTANEPRMDVFALVDAMAEGSTSKALTALHTLLDQSEAGFLFGMVVRQFRLLLLGREILDEGSNTKSIQSKMGVHEFVADKINRQARRFSLGQLMQIYHRILELDEAMKTGQMTPDLALEVFTTEVCGI